MICLSCPLVVASFAWRPTSVLSLVSPPPQELSRRLQAARRVLVVGNGGIALELVYVAVTDLPALPG